jgi:tRNA-2-methylthio-N6-dimethylallyladenosine synthase
VGYDSAFTFIYSKRTGTPAADIEDLTTDEEKHRRFDMLLNTVQDIVKEKMKTYANQTVTVLVENFSKHSEALLMGRTPQGITVTFEGNASHIGKLVDIKITKPKHFSLFGEIVAEH